MILKLKFWSKICLILFLGVFVSIFLFIPKAQSQPIFEEGFSTIILDQVQIQIQINEKGVADVTEKIVIHGRGSSLNFSWTINSTQISHLKINRNGATLGPKDYQISRKAGIQKISNLWVDSGTSNLEISFKDYEAVSPARGYDQLRFEVAPSGISINSLQIQAALPQTNTDIDRDKLSANVYGIHGVGTSQAHLLGIRNFIFSGQNLGPYSTFTAVASFPKGLVQFSPVKTINNYINSMGGLFWVVFSILIPVLALIVMISVIIRQRAREHPKVAPQLYQAPPDNLPPALVGVLYRERISAREIAATILDLAERGYIFILNQGKGEYRFGERKGFENLASFEQYLGEEIFRGGIKRGLAEIKKEPQTQIFSETVSKIYQAIYNQIAQLGYFVENPNQVHLKFRMVGIIFFFLSVIGFILGAMFLPDPPYLLFGFFGMTVASLVIIRMSDYLPLRTKAGVGALERWLSFREFLRSYQQHVGYQEIMAGTFLKYLPYAVALDVEMAWATHFVKKPFAAPDWYSSPKDVYVLSEFTADLYPLIEYITNILESLREPTSH